ncbi:MAG: hypothetical protein IGS23_14015 [Rivularia sp. T60_A2020_040]|nr:hypothetical protein [Rivularia sp. T60_A2020_040]
MSRLTLQTKAELRSIKKSCNSLQLKNSWFCVLYHAKTGIEFISDNSNTKQFLHEIFKDVGYECHEIRTTGINIITVKPESKKITPVAYLKTIPIYAPFAIAGLAPDKNLSNFDELPITTVISAIDELLFAPEAIKNISIAL